MNRAVCLVRLLALSLAFTIPLSGPGAQENTPVPPAGNTEETNSQDLLRGYLQLQEQLHATQLAIERNRQEADSAAAHNAKALADRLQAIEQALAKQRARELDAMQSSNEAVQKSSRVMLVVAGCFASLGFLAMLLTAYFQWRTVNRLSEISRAVAPVPALGPVPALAALGAGETNLVTASPAAQANQRLLGAIDRLEKRILELEHSAESPLKEGPAGPNGAEADDAPSNGGAAFKPSDGDEAAPGSPGAAPESNGNTNASLLLEKGQSLLNTGDAEGALACFDEVLAGEPDHTDALVKKGTALEKLRKLEEAIECYDRAIAVDPSLTIAYLHKGGLFNRQERFSEALECYEKALRTQEGRVPH